jgi:hypothetical protein
MKIKFTYNKKEDQKCWKRYNSFIKKNKTVWGISRKINPIIKIKKADLEIESGDIISKCKKIFKIAIKIKGFVVTTPFSMINDDEEFKKGGIVYYSIYTSNPSIVIAHEIFHVYFEKYTKRNIPNYDEAKEYFTVILNDIFGKEVSKGYPLHQEIRKKIYKKWKETMSIDECIKVVCS